MNRECIICSVWENGIVQDPRFDLTPLVPVCSCDHNIPDHEHGPCEECVCSALDHGAVGEQP